jgi:RHS repeat-associated protein
MVHKAENGSWARHYAYDETSLLERSKRSNRLSRTYLKTNENPVLEPCLYDAHGDMIQMPHLPVMRWDFMDRLAASARQIVDHGTPETTFYVYDASGQRVRKVTEKRSRTRKNERLYVGGFEVFREYDGDCDGIAAERETLHVMDDANRIALVETLTRERRQSRHAPEPVQRYQLANHLGSATLELNEAARLISYEEYAPYGATVFQAGRGTGEVRQKRYRYSGEERDEENGFAYHGARYYAPWLGRWTAADPGGISSGVNLYLYVSSNPVGAVDSTGYDEDKVIDQSDEYGGNYPPAGAPPQPPATPAPNAGEAPSAPDESTNVYPADFVGPLPPGAACAPGPAPAVPSPGATPAPPAKAAVPGSVQPKMASLGGAGVLAGAAVLAAPESVVAKVVADTVASGTAILNGIRAGARLAGPWGAAAGAFLVTFFGNERHEISLEEERRYLEEDEQRVHTTPAAPPLPPTITLPNVPPTLPSPGTPGTPANNASSGPMVSTTPANPPLPHSVAPNPLVPSQLPSIVALQASTHGHHPIPKYLGGIEKQILVNLPQALHVIYHVGLDKILRRQLGTRYFGKLSSETLKQINNWLAIYTVAFDSKYGTKLFEAMKNNGFKLPNVGK